MMRFPIGLIIIAALIALAAVLFCLDRLALWMERKGWIYYRALEPPLTARSAMRGMEEFIHPEIRYVEEEKQQRNAESDQQNASDR